MKQHWLKINATCQKLHGIKAIMNHKKEYFRRLLLMYKEWFREVSFVYIDAFEFLE